MAAKEKPAASNIEPPVMAQEAGKGFMTESEEKERTSGRDPRAR